MAGIVDNKGKWDKATVADVRQLYRDARDASKSQNGRQTTRPFGNPLNVKGSAPRNTDAKRKAFAMGDRSQLTEDEYNAYMKKGRERLGI